MVCTGAKSEEDSRLAARKYARIVQKLGFQTKFKDFKIQNMVSKWLLWIVLKIFSCQVGSCDVKFPIRLEGLVLTHSQFSSYEPELFPGLIYRMVKPRIVLLIFVSGKVGEVLQTRQRRWCFLLGCPHRGQGQAGDLWGFWQHLPNTQELQETIIQTLYVKYFLYAW